MSGLRNVKRWSILIASGVALAAQSTGGDAPVTAPLNPAFVAWQQAQQRAKAQAKAGIPLATPNPMAKMLGRIPSPVDLSHLRVATSSSRALTVFPSKYDLRALHQVTAIRDQGNWGTCWVHAALGSLESSQLKAGRGNLDLSEWHLAWYGYNDYLQDPALISYTNTGTVAETFDGGGWDGMAVALLARGTGAVAESDSPYQNTFDVSFEPTGNEPVRVKLQNALFVRSNEDDTSSTLPTIRMQDVKSALMSFGGVSIGITADDGMASSTNSDFYNAVTHAFYDPTSTADVTNHAVVIVGWDDTYPATNFVAGHRPKHNGAWIVRNSWGTTWGASGYFFISYESKTFDGVAYLYSGKAYNHVYQYDPLGWIESTGFNDTKAAFSNVFTAKADETISAVSFYAPDPNTAYQVFIRKDVTGDPTTGTLAAPAQGGVFARPGYHTLNLANPVAVTNGQKFAVVVKVRTTSYKSPIAIEAPLTDFSDKATANAGEGYISHDGVTWTDLTTSIANSSVCLKAFANPSTKWWGTVSLDNGADTTTSTAARAVLNGGFATAAPALMRYSLDGTTFHAWQRFSPVLDVTLPAGAGTKTLYIRYMDSTGKISPVYSDSITLN
jgi:C1A family cysteine protease